MSVSTMHPALPDVPSSAYGASKKELAEWRDEGLASVTMVRTPCHRNGEDYAGYFQPHDSESSSFLLGWFAGRRSR